MEATMDHFVNEYNMFGPWILEVETLGDIPSHFRDYALLDSDVDIAIKIPINLDRRDVRPGMVLYNIVLIFRSNIVEFLKENNGNITTYWVEYSQIISITNTKNILKGVLKLYKQDNSIEEIVYNVVSSSIIDNIVSLIRGKITSNYPEKSIDCLKEEDVPLSYFYQNIFNKMEKSDNIKILGFQEESELYRKHNSICTYIIDKIKGKTLHSVLFLTNFKELIIINTDDEISGNHKKGYKYTFTFIPFFSIRDVNITKNKLYKGLNNYIIKLKNSQSFYYKIEKRSNTISFLEHFMVKSC